jgi:aspartyl-tRNA(Asn)/glutamyl-tRNA(Gln) amidotransferase subunit C
VETFSADEVLRLARLARLELSSEEIDLFTRQLREILAFAQQVNAVDTSSIADAPPASRAAPADTLRDDAVVPSLERNAVLSMAPEADTETGLFKVPRVFSG